MKKIKLFSLFAALLFAGSAMAATTTIFDASDADWSASGVNLTTGPTIVGDVTWYGRSSAAISSNTLDFSDGVQWTAYLKFGGNSTFKSGSDLAGVLTYRPAVAGTLKVYTMGGGDSARKLYVSQSISETNRDTKTAIAYADGSNKAASIAIASVNAGEMVYIWSDQNMYVYGITFEETAPITEPWVSFSEESVTLAITPTITTATKEITLKGGNLTAGTYSLNVPNVTGLNVTPNTITVGEDGAINQVITLSYTSDVDVLEATEPLSITINEQTAQLDITYSAVLSVDAYTIFHWQMSGETAPVAGTVLLATGGKITPTTTDAGKTFKTESAAYVTDTPDDMKATDGKGVKFGENALSFKVALADNTPFKAGDIVSICGYNTWEISSTSEHTGDLAASLATGNDKNTYAVGQVVLTADADTLYLMRAESSSTCIAAIKVERPTECADAEVALPENPDVEVEANSTTIDAPTLENKHDLTVTYASSDEEVVAVDANTGALTKGTKTGMATITIRWGRQTIESVRYCAGELAYTVTVKSGATAVENTAVAAPAVKVIRDGQLLIIREGKTYTAQGVELR